MTFQEWLQAGIAAGFCTPAYCDNHDAYYEEDWAIINEMEDNDFCWPVVRLRLAELESIQQGQMSNE
tara:strand:+ start:507 stop:707 length:201 start_codon:yes stop_codon:yes gene_type:complete